MKRISQKLSRNGKFLSLLPSLRIPNPVDLRHVRVSKVVSFSSVGQLVFDRQFDEALVYVLGLFGGLLVS